MKPPTILRLSLDIAIPDGQHLGAGSRPRKTRCAMIHVPQNDKEPNTSDRKMAAINEFYPGQLISVVRFVQGYRYLDRCGEALIRLENSLGTGWLVSDPTVQSGAIRNPSLGIDIIFSSESFSIVQRERITEVEFCEVAGIAYETLRGILEIQRIVAPLVRGVYHRKCKSLEEADAYLLRLGLYHSSEKLNNAIGGDPSILHFTTIRESDATWEGDSVHQRIRIHCEGQGRFAQSQFDDRLAKRSRTLPTGQNEALKLLAAERARTVLADAFATILDVEFSLEDEFSCKGFPYNTFLDRGREVVKTAVNHLSRRQI